VANAGCLAATVGAVGAAGAGYAYYRGNVTRYFQAGYDDTRAAVYATLTELRLPITGEDRVAMAGWVEALTAVGDRVHVSIETMPTSIPADGPQTRVGVRVGTFGDQVLSDRILHQVASHLVSSPRPVAPAAPGWGPPQNSGQTVTPTAFTTQTSEPPLS
jgi:hypothetical protein